MRFLYTLIVYLLAPPLCTVLLWRGIRERGYRQHFGERFGLGPASATPSIWVHAVSMGEVQAAAALVRRLRERYPGIPLVMTTVTAAGRDRASAMFGNSIEVRFLPLDLPGAVRRFLERVRPRVAVIFETELWPNLYRECGRRRVPLILASARISPRSLNRYRRVGSLIKGMLAQGVVIAAQGPADAERFRFIGADPNNVHVMGNIKFDLTVPAQVVVLGHALRAQYAAGRNVWIAGSTHAGEEQMVLAAHREILRSLPDAVLILVPRHPNRFVEVADWLGREQVNFVRRSQQGASRPDTAIVLVDTLGELLAFYAAADVAFVGGSLMPIGGHNLLEPAAVGLPVLTGPHNFNGADVAKLMVERGAVEIVADASELSRRVSALLCDPQARSRIGALGRAAVEENGGALAKLLHLIEPLLAS